MGSSSKNEKSKKKRQHDNDDTDTVANIAEVTKDNEASSKRRKTTGEEEKDDKSNIALNISKIANPLADKKLLKRALKLVKKAAKQKAVRRGVKEVVKALRKNEKGIVIMAGNITPIDVISHIPVMCEDRSIPYVFVPAKEELGAAAGTKRPTSIVLIHDHKEYADKYKEVQEEMVKLMPVY